MGDFFGNLIARAQGRPPEILPLAPHFFATSGAAPASGIPPELKPPAAASPADPTGVSKTPAVERREEAEPAAVENVEKHVASRRDADAVGSSRGAGDPVARAADVPRPNVAGDMTSPLDQTTAPFDRATPPLDTIARPFEQGESRAAVDAAGRSKRIQAPAEDAAHGREHTDNQPTKRSDSAARDAFEFQSPVAPVPSRLQPTVENMKFPRPAGQAASAAGTEGADERPATGSLGNAALMPEILVSSGGATAFSRPPSPNPADAPHRGGGTPPPEAEMAPAARPTRAATHGPSRVMGGEESNAAPPLLMPAVDGIQHEPSTQMIAASPPAANIQEEEIEYSIEVNIERVEVAPLPRPTPARTAQPPTPSVSLSDYLRARRRGRDE